MNEIDELEKIMASQKNKSKKKSTEKTKAILGLLAVLVLIGAVMLIFPMIHKMTGFGIDNEILNLPSYTQNLGIRTSENLEYDLELEDISEFSNITVRALALSGKYTYDETEGMDVRVYIEDESGSQHLIFDENNLKSFKPEEENEDDDNSDWFTGMIVDDGSSEDDSPSDDSEAADESESSEETPAEEPVEEEPVEEEVPIDEELPDEQEEPAEETAEETNETEEINETAENITEEDETSGNEEIDEMIEETNETEEMQELTIKFDNICDETCSTLLNGSDYRLIVEISSGELELDELKYWTESAETLAIDYELVEDDPSYDVIIDSAEYNEETQTLNVIFHHDSPNSLPIYIETEEDTVLNYELSQTGSLGGENVTLDVYNWDPENIEQYFEIKVGEHSEKVGFGESPNCDFNADIKNSENESIDVEVEFLQNNELKKKKNSTDKDLRIKKGKYDIKVKPVNNPIKQIEFKDVDIEKDVNKFIKLDDVPENGSWEETYAIDSSGFNFTDATVTVEARGRDLFKCTEWNFEEQRCNGRWKKIADVLPGQEYNFTITPEDPGYSESKKKINLLDKDYYLLDYEETIINEEGTDVKITPASARIKEITIKKHDETDINNDLILEEEIDETSTVSKITIIDTYNLSFENISATITKETDSQDLLKCNDWNINSNACDAKWKKYEDLVSDQYIFIESTPGRSAWGESSDEILLLDKDLQLIRSDTRLIRERDNDADVQAELTLIRPEKISVYYKKKNTTANEIQIEYDEVNETYSLDLSNLEADFAEVNATARGKDLLECDDWDFANQKCGGKWKKEMDLEEGKNYQFNLSVNETKKGFKENKQYLSIIDKDDFMQEYSETLVANYSDGKIDLDVTPVAWNSRIQKVTLKKYNPVDNKNDLKLEIETNETGFMQSFSVDSGNVSAESMEINITAVGDSLFKCANWNFSSQTCIDDNWIKIMSLVPGQQYTITITPGDPGFGENITTNGTYYLHDEQDQEYLNHKKLLTNSPDIGSVGYTFDISLPGSRCWSQKWIAPSQSTMNWVNGTWNFTAYAGCTATSADARLYAKIIKVNSTGQYTIATTGETSDFCTGSVNTKTWSYSVPYSSDAIINSNERVGIEVCANVVNAEIGETAYLYVEQSTPSSVLFPFTYTDIISPEIEFADPTPVNGSATTNNWTYINISSSDDNIRHYTLLDWNNSLVGWWRLEETNGTSFADDSGRGNAGSCTNCPTYSSSGIYGGAYVFDGSNDSINLGSNFNFERTDSFSVSAWFKTSSSGNMTLVSKLLTASPYRGWAADMSGGKVRLVLSSTYPSNVLLVQTSNTFNNNAWHHAVITYNGNSAPSGIKIYIDGVSQTLSTVDNSLSAAIQNAAACSIGSRNGAGFFWNGMIDDVAIFDRTLSSQEILALYNATAEQYYNNFTDLSYSNYTFKAYAVDPAGNKENTETRTITITNDTTAPAFVTDLAEQSKSQTWIYWNWTNPVSDFSQAIVYIDGIWKVNTSNNYYNATSLNESTEYTITVHTKDAVGNVNNTDVNDTATTLTYNNLPVSTTPAITPATAYTNDDLNCSFTITDNDAGDTLSANYTWYKNGAPIITDIIDVANGTENYVILGADNTTKGETWNCSVIPYDEHEYGTIKSAIKTISNSLPTAPVIDVLPDNPGDNDDLAATIATASSDADNDSINYAYQWYKNNVSQAGQTSNTLSKLLTAPGEEWKCEVTPNDGQGNGAKGSDNVTIAACAENWTAQYGSCLINDTKLKYYTDQNSCNTTNDLPGDNGTYAACNYCSENITGPFNTSCVNNQLTQYWIDVNYDDCCAITNLTFDCHINNGSYENQTLSCKSGGGGGGGGGGSSGNETTTPQIFDVSSEFDTAGDKMEKNLGKGSGIKFDFMNESHTISIAEIYLDSVQMKISSTTFYVKINIGETEKIDMNGNGYYDAAIILKSLTATEATLEFQLLQDMEKAPQKINCTENWSCTNWTECNAEGVQIRACKDLNRCGNDESKPIEIQDCVPPSCSDGIQNQGELGIDCGGPCAKRCNAQEISTTGKAIEIPPNEKVKVGTGLIILLSILVALLFVINRVEHKIKMQKVKKENIKKLKLEIILANAAHIILIIAIAILVYYLVK